LLIVAKNSGYLMIGIGVMCLIPLIFDLIYFEFDILSFAIPGLISILLGVFGLKYFEEKIANLKKEGKVLRMGAIIKDGDVSVGMMEVTQDDPLFSVRGGENAFVFYTERYQPIPLTVRGYGAGAGVTAAGVFGDILRTVSFNPDSN
jgi:homoserine dehydrogenase